MEITYSSGRSWSASICLVSFRSSGFRFGRLPSGKCSWEIFTFAMPAPDAIASLQKQFPGKVGQAKEFRGDHTIEVDREIIRAAAAHLKNIGYNYLVDISSVDHFGDEPRFEVVYEFCALGDQSHLRVKL